MNTYPSFDLRRDEPERYQKVLNNPDPVVQGDPVAVAMVCGAFCLAMALLVGVWFVKAAP